MRNLIVGPDFHDYNKFVQNAFNNLGIETEVLSYHGPPQHLLDYVKYYSIEALNYHFNSKFNRELIATVEAYKPDILFIIKGEIIFPETLNKIKNRFSYIKIVEWAMDSVVRFINIINCAKYYNLLYTFEPTDIPKLNKIGIDARFLTQAFDPEIYKERTPIDKYRCDVFFVGAGGVPDRDFLLNEVMKINDGINLGIHGTYWKIYNPRSIYNYKIKNRELGKKIINSEISHLEISKFYNASKICLNIHKPQSVDGLNPRTFEILGAGGFQIVDYKKTIDELFLIDKEIVCYKDSKELKEKILYYLHNDKERNAIAKAGRERVLKEHTFSERIKKVLEDLESE